MKTMEDEIRAKAVAAMVQLEGELAKHKDTPENFLWLGIDNKGVSLTEFAVHDKYGICRLSREDMVHGLTGVRWQNIFRSIMIFLRKENKK